MSDFRGARGSNAGDDFHELWAARHAIRLLDDRDPLQALTVEGIAPSDEAGSSDSTWDGVDCALYEGGRNAKDADRILLEQLKYSAASPGGNWTVARITQGDKREDSVVHRLAKAWSGIQAQGPKGNVDVSLVTNQPISAKLETATANIAAGGVSVPRVRPDKKAVDEAKFAFAAGLRKKDLAAFAGALHFNGGAGSRFAIAEQLLADMAGWTDLELQTAVAELRQFIRHRMRPEFARELITKESVLLGLGVSSMGALFPCPATLKQIADPILRASVADLAAEILAGKQRICLHGPGGIGKTTALQQIEAALPAHSVMVAFDCYGGGTYLDAATLRHRPVDAFLQLSNELATRLRLPMLLGRHQLADPARQFWNRLRHAALAHAAEYPDALIVIAVDAADNAVTAAATRKPPEPCFVHDFVALGDLPANVRFVVTARTGRLSEVALPFGYHLVEIQPFTRAETGIHVRRTWDAPAEWLDAFHGLTRGVPRVQAYALDLGDAPPEAAIERLLPGGRSLDQVFREQFERALGKGGNPADVAKFCAGLIALARPVPLVDLCGILEVSVPALIDICTDMAPAIRLDEGKVGFADEDFEHFVREEGESALDVVTRRAADWLLGRCDSNAYAAQHVAAALTASGRGAELLDLVEREPSPLTIADPIERREAELTRLRLAISVCREAGDAARAMRFVLIGGEGLKTERALRALLSGNPDLAVRFAPDTAGRLILTDPKEIGFHGAFLLHKQVIDAIEGDRISLREGGRLINAWMEARKERMAGPRRCDWRLEVADVAASVETALRVDGPEQALQSLWRWTPKRIRLEVARLLVPRLLAQGETNFLQAALDTGILKPAEELFVLVPMAISGMPVDLARLAHGLRGLRKRGLNIARFLSRRNSPSELQSWVMDTAMLACELLSTEKTGAGLVDDFLDEVLSPTNRKIAAYSTSATTSLDLLFRAHALRAARAGRAPDATNLFEPRPEPVDKKEQPHRNYREEESDRKLRELTASLFPVYAVTATALVGQIAPEKLKEILNGAVKHREDNSWRISRDFDASALAMVAARAMLLLVPRAVEPVMLAGMARRVHGRWGASDLTPDLAFAEREALCAALHPELVKDIDKAVSDIRGRRIGANEKSKALLAYARLLLPLSPDDASAVFQDAVEAASQLDREIIAQLRLLVLLFKRGCASVQDKRSAVSDLSEVLADAAIRLDGQEELPLDDVMGVLGTLDLPLTLANVARWDDADLASLQHTLVPVLKAGLATQRLTPAAAMSLELLLHSDHDGIESILNWCGSGIDPEPFLEESARDALMRKDRRRIDALAAGDATVKSKGRWGAAFAERQTFLSSLPETDHDAGDNAQIVGHERERAVPVRPAWSRETLLDAAAFDQTLRSTLEAARASKHYISASEVVSWAAESVAMRDRGAFLSMLCESRAGVGGEIADKLLELLGQWNSPAVRSWAKTELPDVIVKRLPDFIHYIVHGKTSLTRAIKCADLASGPAVDLILRGVELHGQTLGGDQVFALAGLIAHHLDPKAAADTGAWYARRLSMRIEPADKDQPLPQDEVPESVPNAVARFLYACLGDFDVRVRWRAAHAVRRLARLGAIDELNALINEYGRREETLFRSPRLDFYWIASRLWFAIAWDRIACEVPQVGGLAGQQLLAIALDKTFPHLLLVAFARDACLKLAAAGELALDPPVLTDLNAVGRSRLAPAIQPQGRPRGQRLPAKDDERRFNFDPMDTIPYWYDPILKVFADVSQDLLLATAESWIIDRWGYPGDARSYDAERRRHRFSNHNWSLTSNRHGSNPTLEPLRTHLEWHGLWCAVGELLKTKPLAAGEESDWDALHRRIAREMLTQPPLWSADLLEPVPLRPDFWRAPAESLADWVGQVTEARMRDELTPADRPDYILVAGSWRIATGDRSERLAISSALVEPSIAAALVRALQTMESAWDYGIPSEGEDEDGCASERNPYQMIPWLRTDSSDGGIDDLDPLRGDATLVDWMPGRRVRDAFGLKLDASNGTQWSAPGKPATFRYEVWGERDTDDDRYHKSPRVSGRRLLVRHTQLMEFLKREGLELVIEVEVTREGRNDQRSYDSEDQTPEAAYDRVYRLDREGGLHVAEGRVGAWTSDRPPA